MLGTKVGAAAPRHRERRRSRTTAVLVAVAAAALFLGIGSAGASGSQGTAGDARTQDLVVRQTSIVTGLAPGSGGQPLRGTFDNPGSEPVYVTAVRARVAAVVDARGDRVTGCPAGGYRIAGEGAVGTRVAPGEGRGTWGGLTIELTDTGMNQDACQGVRLVIEYTVS